MVANKLSRNALIALAALVISNLVPLAGVVWWQWDAGFLLLMYWSENLVVGFYNILKMLISGLQNPVTLISTLFNAGFFLVHYGGFTGMHGLFLLEYLDYGDSSLKSSISGDWPGPLVFVEILKNVIVYIFSFATPQMFVAILALVFSHGISFVMNFMMTGEYKTKSPRKLMMAPYARIFILHVVVIAGGVLVIKSGSALPMLMLLVAIKITIDIFLHLRSHRKRAQST